MSKAPASKQQQQKAPPPAAPEQKKITIKPPTEEELARRAKAQALHAKRREVVANWITRALDMGVQGLRDEFRALAKYTSPEATYTAFRANHPNGKNRYQDVPCQDQHRVELKFPGVATDYIHANYVGTPHSDKRFICTQGPLDGTIDEFWAMVVQEECDSILMLCQCIETGKMKCAQYWPENIGETKDYLGGAIKVCHKSNRKLEVEPTILVTSLQVKAADGTDREVRHYQWSDWPDRGVPPVKLSALELLSCVRGSKAPLLVHCSAGIGRTGTIVAIEYILERMMAAVDCANMAELLKELRNQRAWTIQTDMQYLYVHRIMICYFLEKHRVMYESILNDDLKEKFKNFVATYSAVTGT